MIRFINHETESLFGYDRGNLIGQPIDTLVPEDLWGIYTAPGRDTSQTQRPGPWGSI
jgi:hypothetical protein